MIPLFLEKDDQEVQWHAKTGLCMFAAVFVLNIGVTMAMFILPGLLAAALGLMMWLVWMAYLLVIIFAIIKANQGQRLVLPVISDFVTKF